jgi:hypothetical protein
MSEESEIFELNCGGCGKPILVRVSDARVDWVWTAECETCFQRAGRRPGVVRGRRPITERLSRPAGRCGIIPRPLLLALGDQMVDETTLNRHNVSPDLRDRIAKLASYDFSFLTHAFNDDLIRAGRPFSVEQVYPIVARFGKCDFEIAKLLEDEFKRFVALTLIAPGVPHAPAGAIDMYWHFFILHTEQYQKFCDDIWGNFQGDPKYRHHYPATNETRPGMLNAYVNTRKLYVDVFGEPQDYIRAGATPVKVWTTAGMTSGDSYSGIMDPSTMENWNKYVSGELSE